MTGRLAGLVLRIASGGEATSAALPAGGYVFFGASEARAVVELGAHTTIDRALGIGVGVASVQGQLVTLLDLDPDDRAPKAPEEPAAEPLRAGHGASEVRWGVLAQIESGESVLLVGGRVLATGLFPTSEGSLGIVFEGREVPVVSIHKLYRKVETRIWERRALVPQQRPPAAKRSERRYP